MGWVCADENCNWRSDSDELTVVVRHEIENEGHEVHRGDGLMVEQSDPYAKEREIGAAFAEWVLERIRTNTEGPENDSQFVAFAAGWRAAREV